MIDFKTSVVIKTVPKVAAVYQVIFDNGYFYIGATHDLYKRIAGHKANLKSGKPYLFDIAIQAGATSCELFVIQVFDGNLGYRKKSKCFLLEKKLIKKNKSNSLLINSMVFNKPKVYKPKKRPKKKPKHKNQMWGNID